MKQSITKFDLTNAFKALDEIGIPEVGRNSMRRNAVLKESATRHAQRDLMVRRNVPDTNCLLEDYYDVNDAGDLEAARGERDAEIAKAKLARIEKIVDLDAKSEEDILPSYVGKYIIQCPQCMTLFYKDKADVEESADDPNTVNIGEKCQHCGNEDGYTLIGKVGGVSEDEAANYEAADENTAPAEENTEAPAEEPAEEKPAEEKPAEEQPAENTEEKPAEENSEEEINLSGLDELNAEEENKEGEEEEEKKESLYNNQEFKKISKKHCSDYDSENLTLNENKESCEDCDKKDEGLFIPDVNVNLDAHDFGGSGNNVDVLSMKEAAGEDIDYKGYTISYNFYGNNEYTVQYIGDDIIFQTEDEAKAFIDSVTNTGETDDAEISDEVLTEGCSGKDCDKKDEGLLGSDINVSADLSHFGGANNVVDVLSGGGLNALKEEELPEPTEANINAMYNSKEFKEPISDEEVQGMLADSSAPDDADEIKEESFNTLISNYLTEVYANVKDFTVTDCAADNKSYIIEGIIRFNSGKQKSAKFTFTKKDRNVFEGFNTAIASKPIIKAIIKNTNSTAVMESLEYKYKVNNKLVEGLVKNK